MTGAKGCWRRCSAPSTMSSSSPTRRSLQWRQLQAHRMIDCIHVMLEIWLKIVTSQLRRMKPARVMCGPQLLLMDQSSLWSSSRMMPMWTRKFTSKCWQKKCCLGSLKVFINYYIFAQEGASSHTPNLTQQWCKDNFSGFWDKKMCPHSCPSIISIDFAIWSILESDVSAKSYSSVDVLKSSLLGWRSNTAFVPLSY